MTKERKSRLREENGVRLPKRVWRVIDAARDGKKLCKTLRKTAEGKTEVEFSLEPVARRIPVKDAQEAIASTLLAPSGDGLFGEETSQTWIAA